MTSDSRILPAHIEQTIAAIAQLHAKARRESTPVQRAVTRLTHAIGKPAFIGLLTVTLASWVVANLIAARFGAAWDPAPFAWLQAAVSVAALYVTLVILESQQRDDVIASYREQLTLELAILSEQKSAKIIELLESLRRDDPMIENRIDAEAVAMSMPADPEAVLDAIKESTAADEVEVET